MPAAPSSSQPAAAPLADGPIAGCRVLEMGSTVAGPFCGRLLADCGAEVIKVEPAEGDPVRTMARATSPATRTGRRRGSRCP
jgi:crotonobetainyl-CoA:carnitine CoA-transferase CaiB-like acyl-CoA transferase